MHTIIDRKVDASSLTSQLEDFSGQVLHDSGDVDGSLSTDSNIVGVLAS